MSEKNSQGISQLKNFFFPFFIFLLVLSGCDIEQKDHLEPEFTYLVSYEKIHTLQKNLIILAQIAVAIQYPEMNLLRDSTKYSVDVYRIIYRTLYKNQEIIASGLACIPVEDGVFPILSFQNGTNSAHMNAPTENASDNRFMLLQGLAGNGYIMLIPDYIGFGASDTIVHPYYVKEPTNAAVIDLILASREFIDYHLQGVAYNHDCYLAGYSQGAWASLSALDAIEHDELLDIHVKAASCGAGAYDLVAATNYILSCDTFPGPQYLPNYIYSHTQYGALSDPLDTYFQEPYASIIPDLFDGSMNNTQVNAQLTDTISELLTSGFIHNFNSDKTFDAIREDMASNSISAWRTNSLIRFYHGTNDLHVSSSQSRNIFKEFQSSGLGDRTEYLEIQNSNHKEGALPWGISTLVWFNEIRE